MFKRYWLFVIPIMFWVLFYSTPVNAATDAINLNEATILNSPADVASWPKTTDITSFDWNADGIRVDFSKRDGSGRWPDYTPSGWDGPLEYTLWAAEKIDGRWYASGPIQFWNGLDRSGGPPACFSKNWFYAADRWGPLAGRQPAVTEEVGFFVTAGNARGETGVTSVKERSNVITRAFPSDSTDPDSCETSDEPTGPNNGNRNAFPSQPVPAPPTQGLPTNLGQLIQQMFSWALGILGIAVFVVFFYSGFLWLTAAGNTARIGEARSHMTNAIFGAILLLSSYLILYTINPDFVRNTVNLPGLGPTTSTGSTPPTGGAPPTAGIQYNCSSSAACIALPSGQVGTYPDLATCQRDCQP